MRRKRARKPKVTLKGMKSIGREGGQLPYAGTKARRWVANQPSSQGDSNMVFETLKVRREGAVLFVEIASPPMNLLGPELVRDLGPGPRVPARRKARA